VAAAHRAASGKARCGAMSCPRRCRVRRGRRPHTYSDEIRDTRSAFLFRNEFELPGWKILNPPTDVGKNVRLNVSVRPTRENKTEKRLLGT